MYLSVSCLSIHVCIKLFGFNKMKTFLESFLKKREQFQLSTEETLLLREHTKTFFKKVRRSKYWLGNCLSTSVALWYTLERQGLATNLHIGIKDEDGAIKAHAWLELNKIPLNASLLVREKYTTFNDSLNLKINSKFDFNSKPH